MAALELLWGCVVLACVTLPACLAQTTQDGGGGTTLNDTVRATPLTFGDKLSNCRDYGQSVCTQYAEWARQNCMCYCGYCENLHFTTPVPRCEDVLPNCADYDPSACTQYAEWAQYNCRKSCNLCTCVDKANNCAEYGRYVCSGRYEDWGRENCALTCDLCSHSPIQFRTTQAPNPSCSVPAGHTLLFKAVAGAPGDVYSLWSSPNTALHDVTEAATLSSSVMAHYKAPMANSLHTCTFDRIKVSIYNNCVEQAYVTFNGRRSKGRDDWFTATNLITSSFGDLTPFSGAQLRLSGDPNTGREFYVGMGRAGSASSVCEGTAWFFVGTRTTCSWEAEGDKPAFYFATGHTRQQLQSGFLESGDVLAITGQGGSCSKGGTTPSSHNTQSPQRCVYKGNVHQEGEWWTDGCEYNCTCHNAAYQCFDLCKAYPNLPANCLLVKMPFECCPEPQCINGTTTGCYYKGIMHSEGDTWTDGCDYRCTCTDGSIGQSRCTTRCPTLQLPPQCHMTPAPAGKCCPVPVCPDNVHVTFPEGYIQE